MTEHGKHNNAESIFHRYYTNEAFQDRFISNPIDSVDVLIPVIHTNELWESNLTSFYREVPIKRLLIGDGGCIDNSLEIARKFPRVVIYDHKNYTSLGYSIRKLIEAVETKWFIYLHSDVFLPDGWFDIMKKHQGEYDWFGCPMRLTIMVDYMFVNHSRPYAGSQMGRREAFIKGLGRIDDDYVYRQEDFVFADLISKEGFKEGRIEDTFHYHQVMHKPSKWGRTIKHISVDVEINRDEEIRTYMTQVKGIIKYLDPTTDQIDCVKINLIKLMDIENINWPEFRGWIAETNQAWLPYTKYWRIKMLQIMQRYSPTKLLSRIHDFLFSKL